MASPIKFTHYAGAQTSFKPPLIANENAFLGDVSSSEVCFPLLTSHLTSPLIYILLPFLEFSF